MTSDAAIDQGVKYAENQFWKRAREKGYLRFYIRIFIMAISTSVYIRNSILMTDFKKG